MDDSLKNISSRVIEGKVALVLGSGASVGATLPEGRKILLGDDLKNLLCTQFLSGSFKDYDLKHVSDMAISNSSLFDVQDFIRSYFQDIVPAKFHLRIPNYKWRAIFTTNYDRLIEACYEQNTAKIQTPELILTNDDRFDATRTNSDLVPLVKLHGCITRTRDEKIPLILTVDQYNDSLEQGRDRLFKMLYDIAYENTIVFVGHSLQDHNLRAVMGKLQKEAPHGQRHYLLRPGIEEVETKFWAQNKITAVKATFEDLIKFLEKDNSDSARKLSAARPNVTHPIQQSFTTRSPPSDELIAFLSDSVEYVFNSISYQAHMPNEFYRGVEQGWYPIAEGLSVKRGIEEKIFQSVIVPSDIERDSNTELFVIKSEAGSGKTILLRQIAWRGGNLKEGVFLWVKQSSSIDVALVEEICSKTNERVFVIWDDSANNFLELLKFVSGARSKKLRVTIITAERYNEWNMRCDGLEQYVSGIFELGYLSEREIEDLLEKLETYDSLGPNLITKNLDERKKELKEIHGRQLLVALHEATMGESFENIVYDEYTNLEPLAAKQIYLTVCTLNRLRVPIRAGLISRIHDITFEEFYSRFYKPLEKVVFFKEISGTDITYSARHPEVAEIVFRRALDTAELRYVEYIQILSKLNSSYSSDHTSFRQLIKARSLIELFPSHEDIRRIYEYASSMFGADAYLLQQMANYERLRSNGNLEKAAEILTKARITAPHDRSILHSISIVWRDKASKESDPNLRARFRRESRVHLEESLKRFGSDGHIKASLIALALHDLEDLLSDTAATQNLIDEAVRQVQRQISENKQTYPSDAQTLQLEAKLADLLNDHETARIALEKSFEANDREPYLAIRLSAIYQDEGQPDKALNIIQQALERRRTDHKLNFHLAELLKADLASDVNRLIYHYRRAYTPGDSNYQAQFWFARFAFESDDLKLQKDAAEVFETLRSAKLSHSQRIQIRDYSGGQETPTVFSGVIVKKRMTFGFIKIDGSGKEIFCPSGEMKDDLWDAVSESDRVKLNIGYSFKGAVCCNVTPE